MRGLTELERYLLSATRGPVTGDTYEASPTEAAACAALIARGLLREEGGNYFCTPLGELALSLAVSASNL